MCHQFAHSLDVAMKALAEFEAGYLGERRPDGTLDNFSSNRNRPKWRYAIFVAALLHDAGKVFNVSAESNGTRWSPLLESLAEFINRHPQAVVTWRGDPVVSEKHAALNPLLAARILKPEALAVDREIQGNEVSRFIRT